MRTILFIALCIAVSPAATAQCTPGGGIPSAPNCSTATPLANNANITSGTTYSDQGATGGTFTGVQLNGGTLVLCGTTTLTNLSWNSGTVWVSAGANVTFNATAAGSSLNGSADAFYNFSTATFGSASIPLEIFCNKNGVVYNASGASIVAHGNVILNQGTFDNNGSITADTVTINNLQPSNTVCLGPVATTNVNNVINNSATDPVTVSGTSNTCVGFGGVYQGTGSLTTSSNVLICVLPGATAPTQAQVGSAMIVNPCSSCGTALPIVLVFFTAKENGNEVQLQWETASEENAKCFVVERNTDGQTFNAIDTVPAQNKPSSYTYSTRIDETSDFRLKMIDLDGDFVYSRVVRVEAPASGTYLSILSSNPAVQPYLQLSIYVSANEAGELAIIDDMGRVLKKIHVSLTRGSNEVQIGLNGISAGHYFIKYVAASGKPQTISFIKL